jgi:hypothetical protein
MMGVQIRWTALGVLVGILIAVTTMFLWGKINALRASVTQPFDAPSVVHEIQGLNELVSVKYTIQKVIALEEKKSPLGSEKLLLFVQAEALGGIDLSKFAASDVQTFPGHRILVTLPPPTVVYVVIDDKQTKVWDRSITWWTPWVPFNPDLERQARVAASKAIEEAAIEMGILNQARSNAETSIRNLLQALGAKSVTFQNRSALRSGFEQRLNVLRLQRKPPGSFAGCVKECRGKGRRGQRVRRLRSTPVAANLWLV